MSTAPSEPIDLGSQLRRTFIPTAGEQGRPLPLRTTINYAMWLTRPEIAPMSSAVMVVDVLFSAHSNAEIWTAPMIVAACMLAVAIQVLHVANCLADRWVDAEYKSKYSRMVRDLGVRFVAREVYFMTAFILAAGCYVAWATGHPDMLAIVVVGTALLLQYSLPPWRFKSAGVWQIPFTFLGTMVFPGLVVLRVYDRPIEIPALLGILGVGLTITGIFSINTAEDIPEDAEHGIRTSVHALGVRLSFIESFTRVCLGAALVIAATSTVAGPTWTLLPYLAALAVVLWYLGSTLLRTWNASLDEALLVIRSRAKLFAVMIALIAWAAVIPAAAVFAAR